MWYFDAPTIIYGEGALAELEQIQGSRAFIVTDPVLHKLGFTENVAGYLRNAGMEVAAFTEVEPEPSLQTVQKGAEQMRGFEPDVIVGLGGGSCIDAAKAMWVLYERPDLQPDEISPMIELNIGQKAKLIAIPTTAGTGSEATWATVLTDKSDGRKLALGSRETMPTIAIVDPEMSKNMPPRLTADTGLDALTHAVEGYISSFHNDFTDGICLKAIQLIFSYLPRAYENPHDMEAREHMANAATLAGLGFINSWASLAHAMGHAFGGQFHVPHGRSVSLFLPYTLEYIAKAPELTRFRDIAHALRLPEGDAEEPEAARAVIAAIRDLHRRLGQPLTVAELGISRKDYEARLEDLVEFAEGDGTFISAVRIPEREDLENLFLYAYDGREIDF
ncbi:MAG TPA: iron-containing alcohol dehydrogenase [Anaerolineae bacterium]|nr:iron-containing alcohol dehydrogenase [Anaerolineae bacterium]